MLNLNEKEGDEEVETVLGELVPDRVEYEEFDGCREDGNE